jgi:hypothetical protein
MIEFEVDLHQHDLTCSWIHKPTTQHSDRGDFLAKPVEILVFASPSGYMLTSSNFPLLNWGIFDKVLQNNQ